MPSLVPRSSSCCPGGSPCRLRRSSRLPGLFRRPAGLFLLLLWAVLFLCTSCRKKTVWHTDYDAALQDAKAQGKELFVLFSGEDWDGKTAGFRTDVLNTEEFSAFVKDRFVLLNIDL